MYFSAHYPSIKFASQTNIRLISSTTTDGKHSGSWYKHFHYGRETSKRRGDPSTERKDREAPVHMVHSDSVLVPGVALTFFLCGPFEF